MKALRFALAALLLIPCTAWAQSPPTPPPMNFGTPPAGTIPILFNDHHVYTKPDKLTQGRVLAALVRDGQLMVPLRSMFEQMGATVSYDPGTKTADVSKPGSDVKVTVGVPQVTINGETRPLDVPPQMFQGYIIVPVRVISEGMGAYVQWVGDKQLVVVRYMPSTPPPAVPTASPAPAPPPPTPTPAPPARNPYEHFIVGDYVFNPKVYNEFSPGNTGKGGSYAVRGAVEFPAFGLPWMLEGDYRTYAYPHETDTVPTILNVNQACNGIGGHAINGDPGCVSVIGAYGQVFVPSFTARDIDFDGRLGLKIAEPRIYIGVGYLHREENYGYPKQNGFGFGAEKLPDLQNTLSVYGSVWYYPSVSGNFTFPTVGVPITFAGQTEKFQQRFLKYQIGGTLNLGNSGLFLDAGFLGDTIRGQNLSPSDATHNGGYLGLGIKF